MRFINHHPAEKNPVPQIFQGCIDRSDDNNLLFCNGDTVDIAVVSIVHTLDLDCLQQAFCPFGFSTCRQFYLELVTNIVCSSAGKDRCVCQEQHTLVSFARNVILRGQLVKEKFDSQDGGNDSFATTSSTLEAKSASRFYVSIVIKNMSFEGIVLSCC